MCHGIASGLIGLDVDSHPVDSCFMACTLCGATLGTPPRRQTGPPAVHADRVRVYPQMKPNLMKDGDLGQFMPRKGH